MKFLSPRGIQLDALIFSGLPDCALGSTDPVSVVFQQRSREEVMAVNISAA